MKVRTAELVLTVAIREEMLIINAIPPRHVKALPQCEVHDVGDIPGECLIWLDILKDLS